MKELTVIIPVYNVEKYVAKCVESILAQDADKSRFEVLYVIDGSTDNSEQIIKALLSKSPQENTFVLSKANGGLSSARNFGVENSNGNYIWFVDSDDWIEPDSISYVLSLIEQHSPQVIAQTYYFQELSDRTVPFVRYKKEGFVEGHKFCGKNHSNAAQFYIVSRKFWVENSFYFRLGMFHEDGELTPRMLYTAKQVYVSTKPLYHILVREGSITHTINPKRCYDYMIVLDTLYQFYKEKVKLRHRRNFAYLMSDHVVGIMNLALQVDNKTRKDVHKYLIKNKSFVEILFQSRKWKMIVFSIILKIISNNPLTAYKILKR